MNYKRVIPCLDVDAGRVVKGVQFVDIVDAGNVDLENCDRETIHAPGLIQPHGAMLAALADGLIVTHASANLATILGCPAEDIIGRTLGLPVQTDARLRERSFGRLEGAPTGSLRPEVTGIVGGRIADIVAHPVEGESLTDVADRCADFVSWLGSRSGRGDIVIVAHGGTVRLLRAALAGTPLTGLSWGTVANASVHRITYPTLPTGPLPPLAVPVGAPQTRHPTPGLHPTPSGH